MPLSQLGDSDVSLLSTMCHHIHAHASLLQAKFHVCIILALLLALFDARIPPPPQKIVYMFYRTSDGCQVVEEKMLGSTTVYFLEDGAADKEISAQF